MKTVKLVVSALLLLAAAKTFAQDLPISTDGTDPKTWDPKQDAVASGKKNHVVIFEDSEIRVLSVTVPPGEVEILHHHQWPSIIVYDRPVKSENRDGKGNLLAPKQSAGDKVELPRVIRVPPEALHSVSNLDTTPLHLIRIEFKNGFPKQEPAGFALREGAPEGRAPPASHRTSCRSAGAHRGTSSRQRRSAKGGFCYRQPFRD